MSNIDPIQDLEFDPRSISHYRYDDADISWPISQPQHQHQQSSHNHSPIIPQNEMIPKRSTSPQLMNFEPNTFHHTATYPPSTSTNTTIMSPLDHHQHHQQQTQQHAPSAQQQGSQHTHQHHHQHQDQQHWHIPGQSSAPFQLDTTFDQQAYTSFDPSFQTSPTEYPVQNSSMDQANFEANLQANVDTSIANTINAGMNMNNNYTTMAFADAMTADLHPALAQLNLPLSWPSDYSNLYAYSIPPTIPQQQQAQQIIGSPVAASETYTSETHSVHSWEYVDHADCQSGAIFNPQETLHPRTLSDSSSDNEQHSRASMDGFVDIAHSMSSPSTDGTGEMTYSDQDYLHDMDMPSGIITRPLMIPRQTSESHSGSSPPDFALVSPSRGGRPRKSTATSKIPSLPSSSKGIKKVTSSSPKDGEKRVGRRKGPLREDQRKQASEIRKLGACIRCRFLKKTCDPGSPCLGCQPSHARLWLVPCTRIDIKDLGYFVKDWNADYQRHVSLGFSVGNIKGFSEKETTLFITHGYGHYLPVSAREIYVRDEGVFGLNWVEADNDGVMSSHEVNTARLAIGEQGVSNAMISDYLDRHLDSNFEGLIDKYFMGSPFFPEILKVVYRFWVREKTPAIRTALKFVLAYNLTQAVCLVKPVGEEQEQFEGAMPEESYFHGNVAAPVMINFSIKCAMAEQWRSLQQEVLAELSTLYTRVYSKDKLKHWPTIFMIASVLLVVWEEMQFDCRYRIPDQGVVEKFCKEMTDTPVGVVVGLFSAISQKVPSFLEWDTHKHQESLNSDPSVCQSMEEVRDEIKKNEPYLRSRSDASFDRNDFDCLSNMFVSKLVIRAH